MSKPIPQCPKCLSYFVGGIPYGHHCDKQATQADRCSHSSGPGFCSLCQGASLYREAAR